MTALCRSVAAGISVVALAGGLGACGRAAPAEEGSRTFLAAAIAATPGLPVQGRLSGFGPFDAGARRASAASPIALPPDARIAIAQLEKRALAHHTAGGLGDLGVTYLLQGDTARAITTLREAIAQAPDATAWNDLSAAYLTQAGQAPARKVEYLARALDAAVRSLVLRPSNDAKFNRALALQQLAPVADHAAAWQDYLQTERDPEWVRVATRQAGESRGTDARDAWETRRYELDARLPRLDREFVTATARQFPEATREYFERETLVGWANAVVAQDAHDASARIAQGRLLADAFEVVTGDACLSDELAVLRSAGSSLARGHLDYAASVAAYEANDYPQARRLVEGAHAVFARARSSYQPWASLHLATISFQEGQLQDADARLAAIERDARRRASDTLLGRTLWVRGLVFLAQWRLTDALRSFRESAALYERANEREYAVSLYHHLADALRMLGEQHESWQYIGRTLDGLPSVRKPLRRYLFLFNASLFASSQELLATALVFQDAAVREAAQAAPEVTIEAMTQRAAILLRSGNHSAAARDLDTANERLARVSNGYLRQGLDAEIAVLRAETLAARANADPAPAFLAAISFFEGAEPARVPRLFLALARLQSAAGSHAAAEDALGRGIERLERQQARLGDESLKISYFDDSWALFPEMVNLQLRTKHDGARAFEFAERSRARSLLAAAENRHAVMPRRGADLQASVPRDTVLVYYVSLPDRLLIWTIDASRFELTERSIPAGRLSRLVASYRDALAARRDVTAANADLHRALIEPVADAIATHATVVFVPDGDLQQLPFATLRSPVTGRYLVEDVTTAVAPSATFFVSALSRRRERGNDLASALLVGNPAAAANSSLPGADREASGAAPFYPRHALLRGRDATKERFVRAAPDYDVVHFGGHAFANAEYPLLSRLVFASGAHSENESLFAHEIARLRFPRTQVVVLAACSTAAGTVSRGEGVVSAARPFLGAGVPTVVASQWDVDDRSTELLFLAFHRELSRTKDPARALRAAQLALLRGGDPFYAAPASWGAFVALGSTAP